MIMCLFSILLIVTMMYPVRSYYVHKSQVYARGNNSKIQFTRNNIDIDKEHRQSVASSKQLNVVASDSPDNTDKEKEKNDSPNLTQSYIILFFLILTFTSNQWSRQALYYLCDFSVQGNPFNHINVALNFDKEMYAALASFGFTITFALTSIWSGNISDKYNRKYIIALSSFVWSISTYLQGFAQSFVELVPFRILIGISQALYNPAAYTLLAEIFPKSMVGAVNGIFTSGIYFGGSLASLSILLDSKVGWRDTLNIVGGLGMLISALAFVVVIEPRKNSNNSQDSSENSSEINNETLQLKESDAGITSDVNNFYTIIESLKEILESDEARSLYLATFFRFCAGFSIGIWKAPFIFDKFPGNEALFASANAFIIAIAGVLSSLVGGYISDAIANPKDNSRRPYARAWVPAVGSLLAAPLWIAFVSVNDPIEAAGFLLLEYLVAECWFGPTLAALFVVVPKERRGLAQGLFSFLTAIGNIAPVIVGALAGGALGSYQLQDVLLYSVSGSYILCSLLFVNAALIQDKKLLSTWKK